MGLNLGGSNPQPQGQAQPLTLGGAIPAPASPNPFPPAPANPNILQLSKGQQLVLVKPTGKVENIRFGGGWDTAEMGSNIQWDLDLCAIILDAHGKTQMGKFVCFDQNYRRTREGALVHNGDNTTGKGEGIDETIDGLLSKLEPGDQTIKLFVHIFDAPSKGQHFGLVRNAFIQLDEMNAYGQSAEQLARFSLTDNYSGFIAVELGEIVRNQGAFQFNATGVGLNESCEQTLNRFL